MFFYPATVQKDTDWSEYEQKRRLKREQLFSMHWFQRNHLYPGGGGGLLAAESDTAGIITIWGNKKQ